MKRIFALLLTLGMLAALTACGSPSASDPAPASSQMEATASAEHVSAAEQSEAASAPSEPAKSAARSLVVYFSWSGNTRHVAESIQQQTGSDLFEIVPKTPYSSDYNSVVDAAKAEQQNHARPEIANAIENIEDYDTIYVGFPNWWGDMPMILYTFFDSYDLSGKTVALFCTSGGSGYGRTGSILSALTDDTVTWLEGRRFSAGTSAEQMQQWLQEMGIAPYAAE